MKGIVSSAMPKMAPPALKVNMRSGIMTKRPVWPAREVTQEMAARMAPVRWSTPKAPPTRRMKPITSQAS